MKIILLIFSLIVNQNFSNFTESGTIFPDKTFPITINSTNAGDRAQYNFTLAFSSDFINECNFRIRFPENYFYDGLGLDYNFVSYNGLNNILTSRYDKKNLIINLNNIKKLTFFTITIDGIKNPYKVGGTANFSLFYECDNLIINQNLNFGNLAITQPKSKIKNASINIEENFSKNAGDSTNYIIKVVPQNDISKNSVIRIVFPHYYDFSNLQTQIINFPSNNPCLVIESPTTKYIPKGNWNCKFNKFLKNLVIWEGLSENIPKNSEIYLKFKGLNNPNRSLVTENFKVDIMLKNSNYTFEYDHSVAGVKIEPGRINRLSLIPELDNNLDISTYYNFILSFEPVSSFKRIHLVTRFQEISNCFIINNLLPLNIDDNIKCDVDINLLDIYNFQNYKKTGLFSRDLIKIKFRAKTIPLKGISLPAELYLYDTDALTYKTGQNITASTTTIKISNALPTQTTTSITSSNLNPNQVNNWEGTIVPLSNYTIPDNQVYLKFSFDKLFKFGANPQNPTKCRYISEYQYEDLINGIWNMVYDSEVSCGKDPLNDSTLRVVLNDGTNKLPLLLKNTSRNYLTLRNYIKIENILNPEIGGLYNINMLVFSNNEELAKEKFTFSINVSSPTFTLNHEYLIQERNYPTLLKLNFDSSILLEPSNQNLNNFYESFSEISIDFIEKTASSGNISWNYNLGLGLTSNDNISCFESNDLRVLSDGLQCKIKLGTNPEVNNNKINVLIKNYKRISIGDRITIFLILKFSDNPNFEFNFKINKIDKGEKYTISNSTKMEALTAFSPPPSDPTFQSTVSSLNIQENVIIRINFQTSTNKTINDKIIFLIYLPNLWKFFDTILLKSEVFFDNTQIFTPKYFYDKHLNIIIINLENNLNSGTHSIEIRNISTPDIQQTINNLTFIYIENVSGNQKIVNSSIVNYGMISCNALNNINISTNIKRAWATGTIYKFEFTSNKNYIQPKFEIILPSSYYSFSNMNNYSIELIINNEVMSIMNQIFHNGSSRFEFIFDKNILKNTKIIINWRYLNNPNIIVVSESFQILVKNKINNIYTEIECGNVNMPSNFMTLNLGTNFDSFSGEITNIELNLPYENYYHWFRWYYKFSINLPKNCLIKISLPNEYQVINSVNNYECYSKGINIIKSCTTLFSSPPLITFIILEEYVENKILTFDFIGTSYFRLFNSNFEINGDYFLKNWKIEAIFSGVNLSVTNIYNKLRVFKPISQNIYIKEKIIDFYPQNESIEAEYLFEFDLRFLQILKNEWIFLFKFPREYDINLSNYIIEVESPDIQGALKNTVRNREIEIWGFYSQNLLTKTKIYIRKIMNPIKNGSIITGKFEFSVLNKSDRKVLAFTNEINGILVSSSPKIMEIISLSNTNKYIRYNSNYVFEINSNNKFIDSKNNGLILIDIPYDYNLNPFLSTCTTQEAFSLYSICNQKQNRITVNSANKEYFTTIQGNLIFNLNTLRNPEKKGQSGNFIFMNYDGVSKNVISRTFPNLSISSFSFDIDGLEIFVNNNEIIELEVGSFIDPIKIKPNEKMKQLLNIIPLYFDSNFLYNKNPVILKRNSLFSDFRIAVPQNMLLKDFYITWSKSGDLLERFYTELEKTRVRIVKGTLKRRVYIKDTLYANKDGLSIPILLSTPNGPYENLIIKIEKLGESKFDLSSNQINFFSGEEKKYLIFSNLPNSNSVNELMIKLSLDGIDKESYLLNREIYNLKLNKKDDVIATILSIELNSINRSLAELKIKANKLCYIYCVTGFKYMPSISFRDVKNKIVNDKIKFSNPIFSEGWVEGVNFSGLINVIGLTASYEYTTYCYSMNLNSIGSEVYSKFEFKANLPQKTGQFTIKIQQDIINNSLRNEYLKRLAALMQINSNRITEKKSCKGLQGSELKEKGSTFISYYVLPDSKEENNDLSPIVFIRNLNKNRNEIRKFIPKLSDGDLLQIEELGVNEPFHKFRPVFVQRTNVSIAFNTSFTQCGDILVGIEEIPLSKWSYSTNETYYYFENQKIKNIIDINQEFYPYGLGSTIIEKNTFKEFQSFIFNNSTTQQRLLKQIKYSSLTLKNRYPTSFQLARGLDLDNQKLNFFLKQRQEDFLNPVTFNITNLKTNTIYNIFISMKNDYPLFPDYLNNYYVSLMNYKTIRYVRPLEIISLRDLKANLFNIIIVLLYINLI